MTDIDRCQVCGRPAQPGSDFCTRCKADLDRELEEQRQRDRRR